MNINDYFERRRQLEADAPKYRDLCTQCIQPVFSCYCRFIQRFDPLIDFVILIHPIEVRRRIATGRMSHLCLQNSHLIRGQDFTEVAAVNQILAEPHRHCVILYPGKNSVNLTPMKLSEKTERFPQDKKLTVFVIDGTWLTAKKMMSRSRNLLPLPRICFTPDKPSNFRVRKQPNALCYSTVEAIHQTIELIGETQGLDVGTRIHDRLMEVFDAMVELQLKFIKISEEKAGSNRYRRPRIIPKVQPETLVTD